MTIEINEKELNESIRNSFLKYGSTEGLSVYVGTAEDNMGVIDVKDNTRKNKRWRKVADIETTKFYRNESATKIDYNVSLKLLENVVMI